MRRKKVVAVLMTAVMAAGMLGCVSAKAEDTIEINFYEHSDNEALITEMVDNYNASQDKVHVNLSIIANDDYDDKIKVMVSGGADVDCFWVRSGEGVRKMAADGALLALDDYIAESGVDCSVYGQMGEANVLDGKTYGLCDKKSCWLLWYNKTLFDEAGEEYPLDLTWDEYADLMQRLTTEDKQGGIVLNWAMNTGSAAAGEYLTDENLEKTKEYISFLNRVYNEDQSCMGIEDMTGSFDVYATFAEGNTYTMINGDWTFQLEQDCNPDFEWAAAPIPHFEDVEVNSTVGGSGAFVINAKTEYAEACFDFIKYCCHSDAGAEVYAKYSNIPAYPSDSALQVYQENVTIPGTEYVFSASVRTESENVDGYDEINDAFKSEATDYLIGNISFDECFDNFTDRRAEILNK